jgi:uncharacterized protein
MSQSDPVDVSRISRRHQRQRRGAQRRRVIGGVLASLGVIAFVLFATDTVRLGGSEPLVAGVDIATTTTNAPVSTTHPEARVCPTFTAEEPLRLWIGGDSLSGALGPALGKLAGDTGIVQPYLDSRVSSGLANPEFFDWPEHATEEMQRLDPQVVVFMIGTNDFPVPTTTTTNADGQPTWRADYAKRVREMLDILSTDGRIVYWVGAPVLRDDDQNEAVKQLNAVAQEVVAGSHQALYIDMYGLFDDDEGNYTSSLPDEDGDVVTMRAGDGVHLTTAGAGFLARSLYPVLDGDCTVTARAIPGKRLSPITTRGSTQAAPGSNRSGSVATTPPATDPPATTPSTQAPAPTSTAPESPPPSAPPEAASGEPGG